MRSSQKVKLTSLLTVWARARSGDRESINKLVVWAHHISGTVIISTQKYEWKWKTNGVTDITKLVVINPNHMVKMSNFYF
jgi:hypothetical protein